MRPVYFKSSFRMSFYPILIVAYAVLFISCSENQNAGENTSGDTGSIAFSVAWQGIPGENDASGISPRALTGDVCQDFEIAWIVAKVYNESEKILKSPIEWDCNLHTATISKVTPGRVYMVIEAHIGDVDDSPEWRGQSKTVLVTAGAQSNVGKVLVSHTSDDTPPTIHSNNPETDATNVAVNIFIIVVFSYNMAASSIDSDSFILRTTADNIVVNGTVTYDAASQKATFKPDADLDPNTEYTVTIVGEGPLGVSDFAGNFLGDDISWNFTTSDGQQTGLVWNQGNWGDNWN